MRRFVTYCVIFCWVSLLAQSPEPPPPPNEAGPPSAGEYVINFNNVSISELIRFLSKISNKNFVFQDSDLQFNVTIVSEGATTLEDLMSALLQILRIHGLSLLEQGNSLIIYANANVSKVATVVDDEDPNVNDSPIITRVFSLQYTSPDKARAIFQPLLSTQAIIEISPETRHLIVTDITANIDKVGQLLKSLDIPNSAIQVTTYVAQYQTPESLIALANQILGPIAAAEGTGLSLVPQKATQTIFIIANPDLAFRTLSVLQQIDLALPEVDQSDEPPSVVLPQEISLPPGVTLPPGVSLHPESVPFTKDTSDFFVYKLQYYQGDKIEASMRQIGASLANSGVTNQDLVSAINSMQWLPSNNSLIFVGTPEALQKVRDLLGTLDVPLRQVFIEVLVLQTTLSNSLTFGVEWGFDLNYTTNNPLANTGANAGSFNQSSPPDFSPSFTIPPTNVPGTAQVPLFPGFNTGVIGNFIRRGGLTYGSIGALLTALQTDGETKIIMNPKILTADANEASMFFGQNTPFTTSTSQIVGAATNASFTIDYRDVGVYLEVTPILGTGDLITLEFNQEINTITSSTVLNTSSAGAATNYPIPTTARSTTNTRIHIPDNYFLVISGMVNDTKKYTKSQTPCLGGLPIIGAAFATQSKSDTKDNLIIFVHPRIISTPQEAAAISDAEGKKYAEGQHLESVWKLKKCKNKNLTACERACRRGCEKACDAANLKNPCCRDPDEDPSCDD